MILNAIVLMSLLATAASGSAIKGREEYAAKGARQLVTPVVEYQRQHYEQRETPYATKGAEEAHAPEQAKYSDSDLYHQVEEAKSEKQQFYEAQPQLRDTEYKADSSRKSVQAIKSEERAEEQRLVQLPEQAKLDSYQQQREESAAQIKEEVKSTTKQEVSQVKAQREETKQASYEKQQFYEARPQVREEAPQVLVAAAPAPAKSTAKAEQVYSKTAERRDEQAQYAVQAPEQTKLEEVQRYEDIKGQKYETQKDELKASAKATVQRTEGSKFEQVQERQPEQFQQAVELTKQDYDQRQIEESAEQREELVAQVREEGALKGGLRPAGAEAEPYAFDYSVEGSSRRESGDQHGVVRGQYTIQNVDGTQRIVDYVADRDGFRAQVQTNEFGTESQQPANVALRSSQPTAESISLRLEGKTRETVVPAAVSQYSVPAVKSAQPFVQVAEVSRYKSYEESQASGYKGAPVVAAPAPTAAKGAEPQLEVKAPLVEPAPYKGQRAEETAAQSYLQRPVEPVKSAELRAPRVSPGQLKANTVVTRASGFESATAHRPVVHAYPLPVPNVVRHVPPSAPAVVRRQVVAPVRNYHQHHHRVHPVPVGRVAVARSQLQHDRYPPASYRREQPLNPRVSFYANNFEDEQPAGFEHSADLI